MNDILYIGNFHDGTGYSRACCETAIGLEEAGARVVCRPITFNGGRQPCPEKIYELEDRATPARFDAVIQHTLPPIMKMDRRLGLNIANFYYEASRFNSAGWDLRLNMMDVVVTTPGISTVACSNSRVKKPVVSLPLPSDPHRYLKKYPVPDCIKGYVNEKKFIFYTISENVRRKNLGGLIKSYYSEFLPTENVVLVIKTNGDPQRVQTMMREIGQGMKLSYLPEIVVVTERLSEDQLMGLHAHGTCFVQASCGEAWSYPAFDAMAMGKTPVVPDTGTYRSYMSDDTGYLVPTYDEPCSGGQDESVELYRGDEYWEVPFTNELSQMMRRAYREDDLRQAKAALGLDVAYQFTPLKVGETFLEALSHATQKQAVDGFVGR
jgi:glycosyltransferase involved in cell wall biosynthesis